MNENNPVIKKLPPIIILPLETDTTYLESAPIMLIKPAVGMANSRNATKKGNADINQHINQQSSSGVVGK
jgi:hypothetical protein